MKQEQFEQTHGPQWREYEALISTLQQGKKAKDESEADALAAFPRHYRQLCHHLSLAKTRGYTSTLLNYLNALVLQGHRELYRRKTGYSRYLLNFILAEFPCVVRRHAAKFWLATTLFYLPAFLWVGLVWAWPEMIYHLISPEQVTQFEDMYNPALDKIGRERQADSDLYMFGYYISHNIGIAFQTFASGLMFVVGSLFFLLFNGMFLGAVAGHIVNLGYYDTFFPFVIGHGAFELTAITIAGAAGIHMGYALIAPGPTRRLIALRLASRESVKLIGGAGLMLVIAAFLEAFWSSSSTLTPWVKYSVGAVFWIMVIAYLGLAGRRSYFAS